MQPAPPPSNIQPSTQPQGLVTADRRPAMRRLLAVVGVASVAATVLALILMQRMVDSYRVGLDTAAQGAQVTSRVADSAASVTDDVSTLAATTVGVLAQGETTLQSSADGLQQIAVAARTNLAEGLEGTSTVASRAATLIETIERFIPGNRDSLAEDLRAVSDGLAPAPQQLRDLGTQLDATAASLTTTAGQIGALVAPTRELAANVATTKATLADVATLADDITRRAQRERGRADVDLWLVRLLVVLVGSAVAGCALWARRLIA
jgi:hypothetical protein